jgi:hypothetical protein
MKKTLHNIAAGLHNRLLDNDLDAEGRRWLADHRAGCEACDRRFARIDRMVAALVSLERPEPGAGFADRILAEVRPAPVPVWARWRIAGAWGRAAAALVLVAAGFGALLAPSLVDLAVRGLGGPAFLFSGPSLLAGGLVGLVNGLDPFRTLTETAGALGSVTLAVARTPQMLVALATGALVSAASFLQLSHMLVAPQRRRSSHV